MNIDDEIEILIRARYPILYILSSEEGACDYLGGLYNAGTGVVEIVAFAPRYLSPET